MQSSDLQRVQKIPISDIDIIDLIAISESRESFWAYRQYMNPGMKIGWFQRDIAHALQQWYEDKLAGKRPKLIIQAPPQHGKSYIIIDFISWLAGKHPEWRTIFTSYSDRLGVRANLRMQRILSTPKYQKVFFNTRLGRENTQKSIRRAQRTTDLLEFVGQEGFFRNTTVRGPITGEGLDIGIIDDPLKGRKDAGSLNTRDMTWDWFTDDFFTRFADDAGFVTILTRWHIDDPVGRMKAVFPDLKVMSYPGLAESGLALMPSDPRTTGSDEALFPEHKSKDFLLERKGAMAPANWQALFQQNPQILGGDIIKGVWFFRYTILPKILHRAIYADTAQKTKEHNDFSVFECWGKGEDGKIYLIDMIRGKWEAPELKRRALAFWAKHKAVTDMGALRKMLVEDKASGTGLIQEISSGGKDHGAIPVKGIERNTDKLTRVMDVVSYIEAGMVGIPVNEAWVSDFVTECEAFTADDTHAHDDQIDPMCDAITDLIAKPRKSFFDVAN